MRQSILTNLRRRVRHRDGEMNKLEARYAREVLSPRVSAGELSGFAFEAMKFRLADKCWYTPDFIAFDEHERMEAHDVKGFWEDDARVKWKATADRFPNVLFVAASFERGAWKLEKYRSAPP